jgi:hypothetical protein
MAPAGVAPSTRRCCPRRASLVSRAFPSCCTWSILAEIYLCHACSDHEVEDGNARATGAVGEVGRTPTQVARAAAAAAGATTATPAHGWATVALAESYTRPLVFVSAPTDVDPTPAAARVRSVRYSADCDANVSGSSWCFDLRLQELGCSDDDMHGAAEVVDWLAVEAGAWTGAAGGQAFLGGNSGRDGGGGGVRLLVAALQLNGTAGTPHHNERTHTMDLRARAAVSRRAFQSWNRSMLTEIYLCHACSYHLFRK